MPRTFTSASSHKIDLSLGAGASLSGAFTLAAIVKRNTDAAQQMLVTVGAGGGNNLGITLESDDRVGLLSAGNVRTNASVTAVAADGWVLVLGRRKSDSTGKVFAYKYATNAWTSGTTSAQFASTPATSSHLGRRADGFWGFDGDIAVAGAWASELTDAQVEALPYSLSAWWAVQPNGLWILDQATTSQKVVDLTGNGANESGITGTAVSTGAVPVWSYGHPVQVERITVTAISLALTPAEVTVTPVALGISPGTANVAMTPAEVTITPVALGISPGTVTLALTPAELTVTAVALGITPGTVSLILTPANVTVTPLALGIESVQSVVVARWAVYREQTTATYREDTRADYREN